MKVLIFTHEQDIDGMGSIIVANAAFKDFDFVPCKTFEITRKVEEKYLNHDFDFYDLIFVTDLCPKEPLLGQINRDSCLKNKFVVLDHHKSEIEEGNDKYNFVHITIENEKGLTSGTSLFYQYLLENKHLKSNSFLDEFVELTRQYDTFEWKTKYHNEKARDLHILFEQVGYRQYLEMMRFMQATCNQVSFNEIAKEIIENYKSNLNRILNQETSRMKIYDIDILDKSYRIGFVQTLYKYRNEYNSFIQKDNKNDIDLVAMIMTDTDTISYRAIKNTDVSKVAVYFGGKGHKNAASSPKDNKKMNKVLSKIYGKL